MNDQIWDWFPFPRIHAFSSVKKAKKFVKKRTQGKSSLKWIGKSAQTNYYEGIGVAESFCVLTFDCDDKSAEAKAAMITHECSHLVDHWLEEIGETECGTETRAYALQCAVLATIEQLGEEWLTQQTSKSSKG